MLGAVFGGRTAAEDILCDGDQAADFNGAGDSGSVTENEPSDAVKLELGEILYSGLGIVRSAEGLCNALDRLDELEERRGTFPRTRLARAMLLSAMERKESRGVHYREDHPERDEELGRPTLSRYKNGVIEVSIGEGFE